MKKILAATWLLVFSLSTSASAAPPEAKQHKHGSKHAHGHHRFTDPERWAREWESPERDRWQKPDQVIARLGVTPAMRVAEIGSGTGYFTVRLARRVPQGKAYGVDIEPSMVDYLARRAAKEKLPQLTSLRAVAADDRIPEAVDLILLVNTYHHIAQRVAYFQRLRAKLRPGGRLAVVEFKLGPLPVGPPEEMRLGPAQLDRELVQAGYRRQLLDEKLLPHQYLAVYVPR